MLTLFLAKSFSTLCTYPTGQSDLCKEFPNSVEFNALTYDVFTSSFINESSTIIVQGSNDTKYPTISLPSEENYSILNILSPNSQGYIKILLNSSYYGHLIHAEDMELIFEPNDKSSKEIQITFSLDLIHSTIKAAQSYSLNIKSPILLDVPVHPKGFSYKMTSIGIITFAGDFTQDPPMNINMAGQALSIKVISNVTNSETLQLGSTFFTIGNININVSIVLKLLIQFDSPYPDPQNVTVIYTTVSTKILRPSFFIGPNGANMYFKGTPNVIGIGNVLSSVINKAGTNFTKLQVQVQPNLYLRKLGIGYGFDLVVCDEFTFSLIDPSSSGLQSSITLYFSNLHLLAFSENAFIFSTSHFTDQLIPSNWLIDLSHRIQLFVRPDNQVYAGVSESTQLFPDANIHLNIDAQAFSYVLYSMINITLLGNSHIHFTDGWYQNEPDCQDILINHGNFKMYLTKVDSLPTYPDVTITGDGKTHWEENRFCLCIPYHSGVCTKDSLCSGFRDHQIKVVSDFGNEITIGKEFTGNVKKFPHYVITLVGTTPNKMPNIAVQSDFVVLTAAKNKLIQYVTLTMENSQSTELYLHDVTAKVKVQDNKLDIGFLQLSQGSLIPYDKKLSLIVTTLRTDYNSLSIQNFEGEQVIVRKECILDGIPSKNRMPKIIFDSSSTSLGQLLTVNQVAESPIIKLGPNSISLKDVATFQVSPSVGIFLRDDLISNNTFFLTRSSDITIIHENSVNQNTIPRIQFIVNGDTRISFTGLQYPSDILQSSFEGFQFVKGVKKDVKLTFFTSTNPPIGQIVGNFDIGIEGAEALDFVKKIFDVQSITLTSDIIQNIEINDRYLMVSGFNDDDSDFLYTLFIQSPIEIKTKSPSLQFSTSYNYSTGYITPYQITLNLQAPSTSLFLSMPEPQEDQTTVSLLVDHGRRPLKVDSLTSDFTPSFQLNDFTNVTFVKQPPQIFSDRFCVSSQPSVQCSDFTDIERGNHDLLMEKLFSSSVSDIYLTEDIFLNISFTAMGSFIGHSSNRHKRVKLTLAPISDAFYISFTDLDVFIDGEFIAGNCNLNSSSLIITADSTIDYLSLTSSDFFSNKGTILVKQFVNFTDPYCSSNLSITSTYSSQRFSDVRIFGNNSPASIFLTNNSLTATFTHTVSDVSVIDKPLVKSTLLSTEKKIITINTPRVTYRSLPPVIRLNDISEYTFSVDDNVYKDYLPFVEVYVRDSGTRIISKEGRSTGRTLATIQVWSASYYRFLGGYYSYEQSEESMEYDDDFTMIPLFFEVTTDLSFVFSPDEFNVTVQNALTLEHLNRGLTGFASLTLSVGNEIREIIFDRNSITLGVLENRFVKYREIVYELHLIVEKASNIMFVLSGDTRGIFKHFSADFLEDTSINFTGSWWNIPSSESGRIVVNHHRKLTINPYVVIPQMQIYPPNRNVKYPEGTPEIFSNQLCIYTLDKDVCSKGAYFDLTPIQAKKLAEIVDGCIYPSLSIHIAEPTPITINLEHFKGSMLTVIGSHSEIRDELVLTPGPRDIDITLEAVAVKCTTQYLDTLKLSLTKCSFDLESGIGSMNKDILTTNLKIDGTTLLSTNARITTYNKAEIFAHNMFGKLLLGEDCVSVPNGGVIWKAVPETQIEFITQLVTTTIDVIPGTEDVLSGFSLWVSGARGVECTIILSKELMKLDSHRRITIYHTNGPVVIQSDSDRFPLVGVMPSTGITYSLREVELAPVRKQSFLTYVEVVLIVGLVLIVFHLVRNYRKSMPNPTFERSESDEGLRIDVVDDDNEADVKKKEEEQNGEIEVPPPDNA